MFVGCIQVFGEPPEERLEYSAFVRAFAEGYRAQAGVSEADVRELLMMFVEWHALG